MMSCDRCFIYDSTQQIFSELELRVSTVELFKPSLPVMLLDLSNYNLGIFQYLVLQSPKNAALLDI